MLYPPFVGVACGVPLGGEPGLLYPLPQPAKNSRAPSTSRQNFAASMCLEVFLCILDPPLIRNKLEVMEAAFLCIATPPRPLANEYNRK